MIRIKNPQVTFAGIVDRLSWRTPISRFRPSRKLSIGCTPCYRISKGVRSKGQAQVDLAPTRTSLQNLCAYRLLPPQDKSQWLLPGRTRLKVPPVPSPIGPRWPNQIAAAPRSAAHWIGPLPKQKPLERACCAPPRPTLLQSTGYPSLPRLHPGTRF